MTKALIIDDDPSTIMLLQRALKQLGILSLISNNLADGIDLLMNTSPDIVFLDLFFSDASGMDVLELKKKYPHLRKLPFIIVSSSNRMSVISACIDAGAAGYLIKPVVLHLMVEELRKLDILII